MNGFNFFKNNCALQITDEDMKRAVNMAHEFQNEMRQLSQTYPDTLTYEEPAYVNDDIDSDTDFFEIGGENE